MKSNDDLANPSPGTEPVSHNREVDSNCKFDREYPNILMNTLDKVPASLKLPVFTVTKYLTKEMQ